jgi:hypothetical protein
MLIRASLFIWFAATFFTLVSSIYLVKHAQPPEQPRPIIIIVPAPPAPQREVPKGDGMISASSEERTTLYIDKWA